MPDRAFAGAVLTGGASRRMGRDKATLPIAGVAMAVRVADALRDAGATPVAVVGAPAGAEVVVADRYPGAGPLGGVLSALEWSPRSVVVVAPCDLVAPDAAAFTALVEALTAGGGAPAVVAVVPARDRPFPLAIDRGAAAAVLRAAFDDGERSLHRALSRLVVATVDLPAAALADADTAEELPPGAG